jgi:hypothetical protein
VFTETTHFGQLVQTFLKPAKGILNLMAFAVPLSIKTKLFLPIASVRYDRFGSLLFELLPQFCAVVALVGEQKLSRFSCFDQFRADRTIMRLAAGQHKSQKTALGIGHRVDFCVAPATPRHASGRPPGVPSRLAHRRLNDVL